MAPDWTQLLAQTRPGMVKIGSGGSLGDAQHFSDLRMFESFDVMKDDHGALPFAQRGQCLSQPAAQFVRFAGIAKRRCDGVGECVRVAHLLASRYVQRGVGDDAMEPGAERLIGQEAVEGAIRMEESLLYRVFRVFVREHDRARNSVGTALMQAHEIRERFRLSALRGDNERMLAFPRRVTRHGA
jgi:hypothetical protein